jgi:hypothetical protein
VKDITFRVGTRNIYFLMKNAVFWVVALCRSSLNRRFGGTYRLHLQGRKLRERRTSVRQFYFSESMLRSTVSRPVCLGIKHPSGAYDQIFISQTVAGLMWDAPSDEKTGLPFTTAAGPRHRSHFRVRIAWDW